MKPQVTPDISDPSHSHVLSCQHWTRAAIKQIITPFLVPKEVVHILNCACAHEAPSNSSICDPSAFSCSRHELINTFLGAQLDHTTRGINERTYSWNLVCNTGCP